MNQKDGGRLCSWRQELPHQRIVLHTMKGNSETAVLLTVQNVATYVRTNLPFGLWTQISSISTHLGRLIQSTQTNSVILPFDG